MSGNTALEVVQWIVILGLSAGLAACLRSLTFMHNKVSRGYQPPKGIAPGDQLPVAAHLGVNTDRPLVLLFGSRQCSSCVQRARDLVRWQSDVHGDVGLRLLWQAATPEDPELHDFSLSDQDEVIRSLGVAAFLYGIALDAGGRVTAVGGLGSEANLKRFLSLAVLSVTT